MNTFTIELPVSVAVDIKVLGEQTLTLDGKGTDWFLWAICNGVRQSVGDADAGKANTPEGAKAIREKFTRIAVEGKVPSGGFGAALSPEMKSLKAALKSKGVTFPKGPSSPTAIETALSEFAATMAKNQGVEFDEDVLAKVRELFEGSAAYKTALDAELARIKAAKAQKIEDEDGWKL